MVIGDKQRLSESLFRLGFALIIILGLYLRFYDLSLRPMHNDEGVNFHFAQEVRAKGYYPYSHENYHGPTYFYLLAYTIAAFDDSETSIRAVTALLGALLPLLLLALRKSEGSAFVLISSLFTALSPSLIFYSRYAIHEMLFLFLSTIFAVSVLLWCRGFAVARFYVAAAALALLVATKETFIITVFSVFLAMLASINPIQMARQFYVSRTHIFYAFLLFIFLLFGIMSGGFQTYATLRELFLAVPQWVNRNSSDVGHHKRAAYYLYDMIRITEPQLLASLLILPLVALGFLFARGKAIFNEQYMGGRFFAIWAFSTTAIYALVKYKTPWLEINFVFPLILVLAWMIVRFIPSITIRAAVTTLVALPSLGPAVTLNYRTIGFGPWQYTLTRSIPYGPGNPFSYVQTSDGMLTLISDLDAYWEKNPNARVLIGAEQYWPLPYYLRHKQESVSYLKINKVDPYQENHDVIIAGHTVAWEHPDWVKKYYRLSDVQECYTYFKVR